MIYIGKVQPSIMEPPIDKNIIDFFSEYSPKSVSVPSDSEEQKKIKTKHLDGFIAGEMKALVRNDKNLISRDCLILDLDDVIVTEEELVALIEQKFAKFDYVLYPTIRHILEGVRYRLVIPLDKSVGQQEYKLLIYFFSNKILEEIIGNTDESNLTWSQLQLLPALTQHVEKNRIVVHKGEKMFPSESGVESAKCWLEITKPNKRNKFSKNINQFKKGSSRYRNTTTELIESLVTGCEKGNRNNRIAQITGGLLARAVDVIAALELVKIANQHFTEPLPEKEVQETFYSIAQKELNAD